MHIYLAEEYKLKTILINKKSKNIFINNKEFIILLL